MKLGPLEYSFKHGLWFWTEKLGPREVRVHRFEGLRKLIWSLFLLVAIVVTANGTVYTCNGTLSDCQSKVNGAVNGDTVVIGTAPGTFTWSTGALSISQNIILTGYGMFDGNKTVITGTGDGTGRFINYTTQTDPLENIATIENLEILTDNSSLLTGNSPGHAIDILGTSLYDPVTNKGGFRMTQCRFAAVNNSTLNGLGYIVIIQDYVTGLIDHCWWDFPSSAPSGGVLDMSTPTSPGRTVGNPSPLIGGFRAGFGQNSLANIHTWGSGWDAVVMEDNLICRKGLGIAGADGSVGSPSSGGERLIFRHNSLWPTVSTHGFGESGGHSGMHFCESYNNVFFGQTTNFGTHNWRAGAAVIFNERSLGTLNQPTFASTVNVNRFTDKGTMVGPADGTNFFDANHRGPLTANGVSYTPSPTYTPQPVDQRIGNVYFFGNSSTNQTTTVNSQTTVKYLLPGFLPPAAPSPFPANALEGFELRDATVLGVPNGAQGGQAPEIACALISSSTAADSSGNVQVTLLAGHDQQFWNSTPSTGMPSTDHWELYWIDRILGAPGGSYLIGSVMNGGSLSSQALWGTPAFTTSQTVLINGVPTQVFLYYPNQTRDGIWCWGTTNSPDGGVTWNPVVLPTGVNVTKVVGGFNLAVKTVANAVGTDGQGYVTYDYPTITNSVARNRIGADPHFWNQADGNNGATKFGGPIYYGQNFDAGQAEYNANCGGAPCGASQQWGAPYPHPLVSFIPAPTPTPTMGPLCH